jgi:hypothetical protein
MLDKMSNIMQRNCNYSNIEKIVEQARYDEEKNEYIVPDPINEEIQFPQVGKSLSTTNKRGSQNNFNSSSKTFLPPPTDYEYDFTIPSQLNNNYHNQISHMNSDELEQRYGRTMNESIVPTGKIRNKRQEQLLNENASLQRTKLRSLQINNTDNDYKNRRLNPFETPVRLSHKYGFSTDKH